MFLEQQISISEWFLKERDTKDWSNDAEHFNKSHFKIYSNGKQFF